MTNSYLLEVIKAFQPDELQEMTQFLDSPLFNRGGTALELKKLYQIIQDTAPEFKPNLLNKAQVYDQVFSGQNFVPGKIEKLMAELNKLLRVYVLTKRYLFEDREVQQQVDWAAWLKERGLGDRALQILDKLKNQEGATKPESLERRHSNLLISKERHYCALMHNQWKGDLNIPQVIYDLDLYYFNYRIELQNRYLLQQKAAQLPELKLAQTDPERYHKESTLLQISQHIEGLLKKELPTVEETNELIQYLNSKEDTLATQSLDHFYAYLRSICTTLINGGNESFIPVIHQLNKDSLVRGFLFLNGKISPNSFLNLVQAAIKSNEHSWAKQFTETYKGAIIGGDEDGFFYQLNVGYCLFAEGRFEEALSHLPDAPSNLHYHHMVRRLELKLYFELRSELLLYKLDAFRKFIERTAPKTISPNLREMDVNFLNILLQLAQSLPKDKARSIRVIKRIEEKKYIADRAWLLEKARELE